MVLLGGEFLVFLLRHLLNQGGVGLLRFLGLVLDAVDWKEFFGGLDLCHKYSLLMETIVSDIYVN